ncbi:LCP family protein [Leucobacter insecticola]|uniref:LCP family protein n=1 Tax=Leucobacter insecticola TaxID=2714934 RepID=A0A6G8FIL0_9MICO|nr:LCP family protein [Leucobacter insecticola]QIM16168.1 LCP family protein [Leucobacter insecticola]
MNQKLAEGAPLRHMKRPTRRRRLLTTIAVAVTVVMGSTAAVAAITLRSIDDNIVRSDFELPNLPGIATDTSEQNILIMGLDSRLDQNGNPLPEEMYQALHAGNGADGGYNANVLILLHIPEDRSRTTGIAIPRDDYVEIAGAPLGVTNSKIKEAYGLGLQQRLGELYGSENMSEEQIYQEARAAGRQTQIETVSKFLGDVRIDHFIEMTMGGFYQIAQAVAPIKVCLNQATEDVYSGAYFPAGVQELDAQQAMSFVRQRRDTSEDGPFLTDLDRSRRQQAFLVSLAEKLKQKSTLTNPATIASLAEVTQNYVALDTNFDAFGFVRIAQEVAQSGVQFVTLPIVRFDMINGASVNLVDEEQIRSIVASILDGSYFDAVQAGETPGVDVADEGVEDAGAGEAGEPGEDPAAADPAPPASDSGLTVYESSDQPIRAGSMPCVN